MLEVTIKPLMNCMKKLLFICLSCVLLLSCGALKSSACINLDINVGTIDSAEGRLFAQIISTFIHERTGTKSIIKYYPGVKELHEAIAGKEVELIVADISETLKNAGQLTSNGQEVDLQSAKEFYENDMQLVLLAPMSTGNGNTSLKSPVLAKIVLEKFPALPRLLKKLSGKIDAETTGQLLAFVRDKGEKPARVAKDFLVSRRLI